jgi:hypothetical protein
VLGAAGETPEVLLQCMFLLQPTSEMFEEEIKVTTTQTDKMGGGKGSANFGPNTGKWSQF